MSLMVRPHGNLPSLLNLLGGYGVLMLKHQLPSLFSTSVVLTLRSQSTQIYRNARLPQLALNGKLQEGEKLEPKLGPNSRQLSSLWWWLG